MYAVLACSGGGTILGAGRAGHAGIWTVQYDVHGPDDAADAALGHGGGDDDDDDEEEGGGEGGRRRARAEWGLASAIGSPTRGAGGGRGGVERRRAWVEMLVTTYHRMQQATCQGRPLQVRL